MFIRKCPICNRKIKYKSNRSFIKATHYNSLCCSCASRVALNRPEVLAKQSIASKRVWKDKKYHSKMCSIQKEVQNRLNIKNHQHNIQLVIQNRPDVKRKHDLAITKTWKNPKVRLRRIKAIKMAWKNENLRSIHSKKYIGNKNPNWRPRGKEYTRWQKYKLDVKRITKKQPLKTLENFNKRGRRKYHLDHIISIANGFKRKISSKKIGNINNLQMLWWKDNLQKHTK